MLAEQTAKATHDSAARVAGIREGTRRAVGANEAVSGLMAAILTAAAGAIAHSGLAVARTVRSQAPKIDARTRCYSARS
ncbi:hypothetical protein [Methylobacterium sp. J-026]|uniref:hypothetical protein n=1 Tax=Methylobacterium sp. J-026 TaxID=2836624 RepID=UPI001FB8F81A|nr:hypothetical protein [Methylobacterium sp. J-026]